MQPVVIEAIASPKPPPEEGAKQERAPREPEWTAEHAMRAADALEGAYSPDFEAEADPPEVRRHGLGSVLRRAARACSIGPAARHCFCF